MYKGTTPTFSLVFSEDLDLTDATQIAVTFSDTRRVKVMEKTGTDLEVTAHQIDITLTQEETLAMPREVLIQVNFLYVDGSILRRAASEIAAVRFNNNLKNEVMM